MKTQHEVLMEDPEFRRLLSIEALVAEASEVIARLMAEQNVSKADLARRLNKSRAWVTQLLSGKANMTVRTLAEVVYALDSEVKLHAQPPSSKAAGKPAGTGWQPVGRRGGRTRRFHVSWAER
jgi:antitoxin component HigA of HigAB toxin-antitoxin module